MTLSTLAVMGELYKHPREDVVAVLTAAVMHLALDDDCTPREVVDQLFTVLPADELWERGKSNLVDTRLAVWFDGLDLGGRDFDL